AIFTGIKAKPKDVLDADGARCFDRIDQQALLAKLQTTPTFRRTIRVWLKAGVIDGARFFPTEAGTPQGGVLSPLLANVALHGLETAIVAAFPPTGKPKGTVAPMVVRDADDFVVLHPDLREVERAQAVAVAWLAGMGLELKSSKTRIGQTLAAQAGQPPGFDFLGFTVRQFPVGTTHSGKNRAGIRLGLGTIIRPSKTALQRHVRALGQKVHGHKAAAQAILIGQLNPLITGWSRSYSAVVAKASFREMDHVRFAQLFRWGRRRHPGKSAHWVARQYWHPEQGHWAFATGDGIGLRKQAKTPIRRHGKVRGAKSPFDGDWSYWATRTGKRPDLPVRPAILLHRQQGRCARCGLHFVPEESWEIDHVLPLSLGGHDHLTNLQLLHRHCHDQKTAEDGSSVGGIHDRDQTSEEPDEVKVSRPVLKTSRSGDRTA
ncbi:MAG: group II intron reverse transcriptase, partial [Dehalococcoidia bacterium]